MRQKAVDLANLSVRLQEIVTQIKQKPRYELEYIKYENKELKGQVTKLEKNSRIQKELFLSFKTK